MLPLSPFLDSCLLAASSDVSGAKSTGTALGVGLAIYGFFKCIQLMRRRETSSVCVTSMLLFCIAYVAATGIGLSMYSLDVWSRVIGGTLAITIFLGGLVCGIVGLALYRRDQYRQGRSQAIWGILLNSIFVVLILTAFVRTMVEKQTMMADGGQPVTQEWSPRKTQEGQTVEMKEWNLHVQIPDGWIKMPDPKVMNPVAVLVVRKLRPQVNVMLIAEQLEMEPESLKAITQGSLQAAASNITFGPDTLLTVNGVELTHFTCTATLLGMREPLTYAIWIGQYGGVAYQWFSMGRSVDRESIITEGRRIVNSFRPLDPKANFAMNSVVDAKPAEVGFATDLAALGWREWPATPDTEGFSLRASRQAAFLVVATIPIDEKELAMDDLASGFFSTYSHLKFPSAEVQTEPGTMPGTTSAVRFTAQNTVDDAVLVYRGLVAKNRKRAYFVMAWQGKNASPNTKALDDAIATVAASEIDSLPPFPPAQAKPQADVLHQIAMQYSGRADWPRAAELFAAAYALSPHNDATLESIAYALESKGDIAGAKAVLEKHADRLPHRRDLKTLLARLKSKLGEKEAAMTLYEEAFKEGHRDEPDLLEYLNLLVEADKASVGVEVANRFAEKGASVKVQRWQAEVYDHAGDTKGAIAIYEKLMAAPTFDPLTAYSFGEFSNRTGEHERSAKVAARLIEAGNDNARTRKIEAWSHVGLKNWARAKESFEKAKAFDADDAEITAGIARVSAMLGEGDNSSVKTPIEPVKLPEALVAQIEKLAKSGTIPAGVSACYLMRATAYRFEEGKPFTSTEYRRVRILEKGALSTFGTLQFDFDPLSERIFVNRLVVTDEDGKKVAEGAPEEQYVVDQSASSVEATHRKVLRVVVPGLKQGHTLEYVVTQANRSLDPEFPFLSHVATRSLPTLADAVAVIADPSKVKVEASPIFKELAQVSTSKESRAWLLASPPAWQLEPMLPFSASSYLPVLKLGDAATNWADLGRSYLKDIAAHTKPGERIKEIATGLTSKAKTDLEKIRILTAHVRDNVAYQAIEFGKRARIPKAADRVLASRYGDCKDQSVLLQQLLTAAGVDAHLALVSSAAEIEQSLPSLDQFNHMIVRVPSLKTGFIDPTERHFPVDVLPPDLGCRWALVLDSVKPRLEAMPDRATFPANSVASEREVTIEKDGTAQVRETVRFGGYFARWIRSWLIETPPAERARAIQTMGSTSRWKLVDFTSEGLEKDDPHLSLTLKYSVPAGGAGKLPELPSVWEEEYLEPPLSPERRFPFQSQHPIHIESKVRLILPGAADDALAKTLSKREDSNYCRWKLEATPVDGKPNALELVFRFDAPAGTHPAAQFEAWQAARKAAVQAWKYPLKLK